MEQTKRSRVATRVGAAALGVGGLSASVTVVSTASAASHRTAKSIVISTAKNAQFGTILVSGGKTLYTLKASKTVCTAQCLKVWPAVLLPKGGTKATAGTGVSASKIGTVKWVGAVLQVTYSGKALYRFVGDTATGQVHGNVTDRRGAWSAFVTAAAPKNSSPSTPVTPTTSPATGTSPTPTTSRPTTTAPSSGGAGF